MNRFYRRVTGLFVTLVVLLATGISFAQTAAAPVPSMPAQNAEPSTAPPAGTPAAPVGEAQQDDSDPVAEALIKDIPDITDAQDKYIKTTIQNLSKLYWALGMLDLREDEAIEHYLFINECETYNKYLHNDFEWNKIKQATRKMLAKNMAVFPTHFEILQPLNVGRYDEEKQQFELNRDSIMNNVKKLDVAPNFGVPICGDAVDDFKDYPRNLILVLVRPFTFKAIPASPELAELYINASQEPYEHMNSRFAVNAYQRMAYMRLKVRMIQYLETIDYRGHWRAVIMGTLEGFEVYADHEKAKLLYSGDLMKDATRHHRRHKLDDDPALNGMKPVLDPATSNAKETDTTTGDNTSETDTGDGLTGTGVDPGGMGGNSDNSDSDIITPGQGKSP
jgi:hypothetical protein